MKCVRKIKYFCVGFVSGLMIICLNYALTGPRGDDTDTRQLIVRLRDLMLTRSPAREAHLVRTDQPGDVTELTSTVLGKVKIEMEKRRRHLRQVCKAMNLTGSTLARAFVSTERRVVYCPVEKTASTFFRRFMYQLDHTDPMRSPFEVPVKMIYGCGPLLTSIENLSKTLNAQRRRRKEKPMKQAEPTVVDDIQKFLSNSKKFVFVRDPYARLFSVYIDKLQAPNPTFWEKWGIPTVKKFRKRPSEIALKCGHDVTFSEFLKFTLGSETNLDKMDPHVRPVFRLCEPCSADYDVIGHMETFKRDALYLSSLLNVSETQIGFDNMAEDSAKDAIEDSVTDAFTVWEPRVSKCITKFESAKRIWKKLQIRGFISDRQNISHILDAGSIEDVEAREFIRLLMAAFRKSKDKTELKKQKFKAFVSAYRSVNVGVLKKVSKMYAADFRLFGYVDRPAEIFDRSITGDLDLDLSEEMSLSDRWVF
ncbi:unnamed protein product [Lymnaea stagnalis]|uniref:Carbohydrate sulfotransferase n=1 Tax=Lymnaea stagnalis TaxID=6523 RepID=A0AAV2H9Z3_LYMST